MCANRRCWWAIHSCRRWFGQHPASSTSLMSIYCNPWSQRASLSSKIPWPPLINTVPLCTNSGCGLINFFFALDKIDDHLFRYLPFYLGCELVDQPLSTKIDQWATATWRSRVWASSLVSFHQDWLVAGGSAWPRLWVLLINTRRPRLTHDLPPCIDQGRELVNFLFFLFQLGLTDIPSFCARIACESDNWSAEIITYQHVALVHHIRKWVCHLTYIKWGCSLICFCTVLACKSAEHMYRTMPIYHFLVCIILGCECSPLLVWTQAHRVFLTMHRSRV